MRAIERFDTSLGLAFSTFAVPQILGEIRQFFRSDGLIKVSRDLKKTALEIRRAAETLEAENGTAPTLLEIAKALSLSLEAVTEAIDATAPVSSISSEQNAIEKAAPFVSSFENKTLERLDIQNAIKSLPEREQTLLFMRYVQEKTQTEIAKALCLSQVQISRMEKKILVRLKEILSYAENSAVS